MGRQEMERFLPISMIIHRNSKIWDNLFDREASDDLLRNEIYTIFFKCVISKNYLL